MKKKEILVLSISVFLTVIAWLVADIIHASTKERVETEIALPNIKNYVLDESIIQILESKQE
jgi:hypothetical protein